MHFPLKNQEDHGNVHRISEKTLSTSKFSSSKQNRAVYRRIFKFYQRIRAVYEFSSFINEFGQSNGESMNTHKEQKKSPAQKFSRGFIVFIQR